MSKEALYRFLLHLPHGMIAGWIFWGIAVPCLRPIETSVAYALGGIATATFFIIRQAFQELREKDGSSKDVIGIAWGFAGMVVFLAILEALL